MLLVSGLEDSLSQKKEVSKLGSRTSSHGCSFRIKSVHKTSTTPTMYMKVSSIAKSPLLTHLFNFFFFLGRIALITWNSTVAILMRNDRFENINPVFGPNTIGILIDETKKNQEEKNTTNTFIERVK